MLSIQSHQVSGESPQFEDLQIQPVAPDADDFEPPDEGGSEEQPNEPASGDGAEGYPVPGGKTRVHKD